MTAVDDEPRWLTEPQQHAWRAYLQGSRLLEVALDADLSAFGVSLPEYEILSMLSEVQGGRMRMSTLADLVVQSRSRVTHTASRLEKRGLVTRQPSVEDGRGVELVLSEDGWETIVRLARVHVESVRQHLLDLLTAEQFEELGAAMAAVRDHGRRRR